MTKPASGLALLACVAVGACALRMLADGHGLALPDSDAVFRLRAMRVLCGAAVGGSLAVAGVLLQSLLRNPLAAPDLLGLSAGAGFAVTLWSLVAGGGVGFAVSGLPALAGAIVVLALVWVVSQRRGLIDPVTMILVGVIVAVLLGSATALLRAWLPDRGQSAARWMMGAISDDTHASTLAAVWSMLLGVLAGTMLLGGWFDAASLGEDEARSSGIPLGAIRTIQLVGAGTLTAGSIVLAGPVGFVGLVCPHVARFVLGPSHRTLLAGAALAGVALVVGADALVRCVPGPAGRVPVGIVTSLIGGPVFLAMLLRSRRNTEP